MKPVTNKNIPVQRITGIVKDHYFTSEKTINLGHKQVTHSFMVPTISEFPWMCCFYSFLCNGLQVTGVFRRGRILTKFSKLCCLTCTHAHVYAHVHTHKHTPQIYIRAFRRQIKLCDDHFLSIGLINNLILILLSFSKFYHKI